jgi:hypothetical protein
VGVEYLQFDVVGMLGFLYSLHKIFQVICGGDEAGDLWNAAEEGHHILEELGWDVTTDVYRLA